jgi:ribosomal protein L12E/L44/L45/RPP1/RPP2
MANRLFKMRDGLIMRERLDDVTEANGMHVNEANKTNNINEVKEGNNPEAEKNGATMVDIANSNKMSRKDNEGNRVPGKGAKKAIKALG